MHKIKCSWKNKKYKEANLVRRTNINSKFNNNNINSSSKYSEVKKKSSKK